MEFSNRGAVVKSWQLKKYKDDAKPQRTLDVVHPQASAEHIGSWPFSLMLDDPQLESAANTGLYKLSSDSGAPWKRQRTSRSTWSDGHLEITKKFHFEYSYVVNVETTSTYNGSATLAGLAWRGGFGDLTVPIRRRLQTMKAFSSENGKLTRLDTRSWTAWKNGAMFWQGGKAFTGIDDRYFSATFLPPTNSLSTTQETRYWKLWDTRPWTARRNRRPFRKWLRPPRSDRWTCACMLGRG